MRLPPMDLVASVQAALRDAGIGSVVGGSGLLASMGLVDTVNDWDLVTDAEERAVQVVLRALGLPDAPDPGDATGFATRALHRLERAGEQVDLLVGFAIRTSDTVVHIPAAPGESWRGLTMARPADWVLAYRAMGRTEKAALLEQALAGR
ncbi:hypothetical protein ACFFGH_29745 [Lysobacter korlensis]|uniref:Uncharacterized protein n=1 Tax=Lysobacter korlensis TaxID=553636 RepID=A0ABV6RZ15_9GAMM